MANSNALILWLFLFGASVAHGQKIIGHVYDSMSIHISFASVVATSCQDEQVLAFTNTDEKGRYELSIKTDCDSITLTARCLGYRTVAMRLAAHDLPAERNFTLTGAVLQEVIVHGKTPPVIARNDTTEYNVASFSDSTEVSLEDLLKKLPGVRVDANGFITYNNKPIERVMIDGDDLFSQNYTLATRNIRADLISKVQVIDRFQENPLMKGIQESDRMVMNLKIKPDRKRDLSGNAELGGGYGAEWKGRAHVNLFSLSRKDKIYVIGNANNSGENALSDIEWTAGGGFQGFGKQQTLQANPLQVRELSPSHSLENAGLPSIFTQSNRSGLVFIGMTLPASSAIKTKISGWAGQVGLNQATENSIRYLLGSDVIDISENKNVRKSIQIFNIQTESEYYSQDKKNALRGLIKVGKKPTDYYFNLLRNQTSGGAVEVISRFDQSAFDAFGSFEYTLKQRESSAIQIVSKTAWHQNQSLLHPEYDWYASFFNLDSSFTLLRQKVVQQQGKSIFMGRWLARANAVQWQAEAGIDWNWGRLQSDLMLENDHGMQWKPGAEYQNNTSLQAPKYFSNLSATRTFGPLLARARLGASYRAIRFKELERSLSRSRLWAAEPRIDFKYTLGKYAVMNSYYGFQQELPEMIDLRPAFVFSDYQLVSSGIPDFAFLTGHQAGLQYRYNQPIRQFSWNIGGNMALDKNQFGIQYEINPFLVVQDKFRPVNKAAYGITGGADHYIRKIHSRIEIGLGMNFLRETAKLNSEMLTELRQRILATNFSYGTAFDTWINVILSTQNAIIIGQNTVGSPATHSTNWFSTAQINVKPNKVFDMKIFIHQVANRVGLNPGNFAYASDCVAYLHLNRWRSTIAFSAVNLLGSRQYEQVLADAFSQSINRVIAVPRFFLLSWEKSF